MYKTLLIKNISALVSCDDQDTVYQDVNLLAKDGIIVSIGEEVSSADYVIDGSHMIAYPGLINAHYHLFQSFSRNLPVLQNKNLYESLQFLGQLWKRIHPDMMQYSSFVGLAELIKSGCTTTLDHHFVFPQDVDANLIDYQFEVADSMGIRFIAARGSLSKANVIGNFPPDSIVQSEEAILKDAERLIHKYHDPKPYAKKGIVLAPCSPFLVSDTLMRDTASLARHHGVRLHTHLATFQKESTWILENLGIQPLEYMESLGWVGDDVWYAHGIHFTDEDLMILQKSKTGICHCPVSNMKLSAGICCLPDLLAMDIPVGLGVDGSAYNGNSSLLEVIRAAYLLHRLHWNRSAPTGYDILKLATRGSARLLGRTDIGQLAPDKACDLFLIDTRRVEMVGALEDVKNLLGNVGFRGLVDYTIIGGKVVMENGGLTYVDEEDLTAKASQSAADFLSHLS